jgi:branched-subunit amino acid transport protein
MISGTGSHYVQKARLKDDFPARLLTRVEQSTRKMITSTFGKGFLLFMMMATSLAVNLDDNLITRLGLDMNYGLVLLVALIIAILVAGQSLTTIFLVGILSFIVNLPAGFILNFGISILDC